MTTGPYFTVPAGTPAAACRGCEKPVYWIMTIRGKRMPVDCHADARCLVPTADEAGSGLSHFATCPQATAFRGKGAA